MTRWVLCAGATHADAPANALRIGLGDGDWRKMSIKLEGMEQGFTGKLPPRLREFICISSFILGADGATFRGDPGKLDNGATWRRDFRFVIPVAEPDFWNAPDVRRLLEATAGFLSDDSYRFEFVAAKGDAGRVIDSLPPTNGRTFIPFDQFEEVLLFSGGMDSLGGAIDHALVQKRKVLLVSHGSSSKMASIQRELVTELQRLAPVGAAPCHVILDVQKHDELLRKEDSQRSRSLLFAAIAGAVAWFAGKRRVKFHENGVIALNLPIAGEILGARATRTVHPRVLVGFQALLGAVIGEPFVAENPYQLLTRQQVAERIRDAGARQLLRHSRSCAHVRWATTQHPFCGICSQCVDRRFAMHAAGLADEDPEEMYDFDLFADALVRPEQVKLALGYVNVAETFRRIVSPREFQSTFGEIGDALPALAELHGRSQDAMLEEVVHLHRRQGEMVMGVMGRLTAARISGLATGSVHPRSLLARVLSTGLQASERRFGGPPDAPPATSPSPTPPPDAEAAAVTAVLEEKALARDTFFDGGAAWVVGLKGTKARLVESSDGMRYLALLLAHPRQAFGVLALEAIARGDQPSDAPPASVPGIGATLDPQAIRELREKVEELRQDEALGDPDEAERARIERERIEDQLAADLKLGGGGREEPPELRRARDRLRKAVDKAIANIKKRHPGVGRHLANTIKKGTDLSYEPEGTMTWRLSA